MGVYQNAMTPKQLKFVDGVTRGLSPTKAADYAGYREPARRSWVMMRESRIILEIQKRRASRFNGDLAQTAISTIEHLIEDPQTPPATRFNAARYVLEVAGHRAGDNSDDMQEKQIETMNMFDLAKAITSGMSALNELASGLEGTHIIDGEVIEAKYIEHSDDEDEDLDLNDMLS